MINAFYLLLESGIPLLELYRENLNRNATLLSGMASAINSFVKEIFGNFGTAIEEVKYHNNKLLFFPLGNQNDRNSLIILTEVPRTAFRETIKGKCLEALINIDKKTIEDAISKNTRIELDQSCLNKVKDILFTSDNSYFRKFRDEGKIGESDFYLEVNSKKVAYLIGNTEGDFFIGGTRALEDELVDKISFIPENTCCAIPYKNLVLYYEHNTDVNSFLGIVGKREGEYFNGVPIEVLKDFYQIFEMYPLIAKKCGEIKNLIEE